MLTEPMPDEAKPVAHALAETCVELPGAEEWSQSDGFGGSLRHGADYTCPMGFHPRATRVCPAGGLDFPISDSKEWGEAVEHFGAWWDDQDDAAAALAEIDRVQEAA